MLNFFCRSDRATVNTVKEVTKIQEKLILVQHYDTISVPLVYTQVVSWSIYSYFLVALMGAQWVRPEHAADFEKTHKIPTFDLPIDPESSESDNTPYSIHYQGLDLYFPFFLTLQVKLFYLPSTLLLPVNVYVSKILITYTTATSINEYTRATLALQWWHRDRSILLLIRN